MEPEGKQSDSSTSKAVIVGTGIACSVIGAILGAVGYHMYQKEEMQKHTHSRPKKVFKTEKCSICLGEIEQLSVLPCGHQYHAKCVNDLQEAVTDPTCPLCRKPING